MNRKRIFVIPKSQSQVSLNKPRISIRWILVFLCSIQYFIQYFVRNSFPVAIVAMMNSTEKHFSQSSLCNNESSNTVLVYDSSTIEDTSVVFNWSASQQSIVLSSYFWGFVLSRLLLSRLAEVVGQNFTIAFGMTFAGILELLSPNAASFHPMALAALRFLIGVSYGPTPSAFTSLLSAWSPRHELASMVTSTFAGAVLGSISAFFISGKMSEEFGWKITFWIGAGLSFIVLPFWLLVIKNTPGDHSSLSEFEKTLLEENKDIKTMKNVPWKPILRSPYVYICAYALFARSWLDSVFSIEGPSYFRYEIGLSLSTSSYVCGGNYLAAMLFMMMYGRISDFIVTRNYVQKINARKIFHFIGSAGPSLFLLLLTISNCNASLVIPIFILAGGCSTACACSFELSIIDFAPNYVGTIQGLLALGFLAAAVNPSICSLLLSQENGWNKSFYLASGINAVSCILYCSFMTADEQKWNSPKEAET